MVASNDDTQEEYEHTIASLEARIHNLEHFVTLVSGMYAKSHVKDREIVTIAGDLFVQASYDMGGDVSEPPKTV